MDRAMPRWLPDGWDEDATGRKDDMRGLARLVEMIGHELQLLHQTRVHASNTWSKLGAAYLAERGQRLLWPGHSARTREERKLIDALGTRGSIALRKGKGRRLLARNDFDRALRARTWAHDASDSCALSARDFEDA
jgi:hypothetical protein